MFSRNSKATNRTMVMRTVRRGRLVDFEALESRRLLATVDWIAAGGGDWNYGANWSTGNARVRGAFDSGLGRLVDVHRDRRRIDRRGAQSRRRRADSGVPAASRLRSNRTRRFERNRPCNGFERDRGFDGSHQRIHTSRNRNVYDRRSGFNRGAGEHGELRPLGL